MPTIVGLDVGRLNVVGCLLKERPDVPRDYYRSDRSENFFELALNRINLKWLIELEPDIVVLEPTGTHYSQPWIDPLVRAGIEVRLVGHDKLHSYRHHLDLLDKNDWADALALACYGFDYLDVPLRFVPLRSKSVARMRDISLRLIFYTRMRTRLINRLKQDLVGGFPSKAKYCTRKEPCGNPPPLWRWIAGEDIGAKKSATYEAQLIEGAGTGISVDMVDDAQILVSFFRREQALEIELRDILYNDSFTAYLSVFENFKFGLRISGILMSQIYPFEKFMGPDGLPEVRKERGVNQFTNRYLSFRRFCSMMGLAPREASSGSKARRYCSGNRLCRTAWWQWCLGTVEPKKRRTTDILEEMGMEIDLLKAKRTPINLARIKVCAKASRRLFDLLCDGVL